MPTQSWEAAFRQHFVRMKNRMAVSEHRYGCILENYPDRADALAECAKRIQRYQETHNTEWLLDAANFLLIEATCPRYRDAHFKATDSEENPGVHMTRKRRG